MHLNGDVLAYWMMEFFSRPSLPLLIDSHYSLHGSCIYLLSLHTEGISSKTIIPPPAPIIINISLVNAINMKWNQVSQKDLILHVFKWFALGRGEKMTIASWAQISAEYKRKKSKSVGSFYSIRDGWHRLSFFTWFYSIGKQVLVLQWGREKISREIDRKKEEKKWWL